MQLRRSARCPTAGSNGLAAASAGQPARDRGRISGVSQQTATTVEWINPPNVVAPIAHYSQVARAGNTLYISGQIGADASGQVTAIGDAKAQARQAWKNVLAILEHFGAGPRNLVKTVTYITHPAYRPLVGEVRDEVFPAPPYPPSTLIIAAALAEPHILVEIEAIAVLND
jgi:enamine deaminase RidA (YjgF/YER057c/UK114 family)